MKKDRLKCPACGSMNPSSVDRCDICGSLVNIDQEEKQILDNLKRIPDVGRKRAEKVITYGLSRVDDLEKAGRDDFASIEGIGTATAEKLYSYLQEVKDRNGRMKLCSVCGSLIGARQNNCPRCEEKQKEQKEKELDMEVAGEVEEETTRDITEKEAPKTCPVCGTSLEDVEDSCPVCGNSFIGKDASEKKERKGKQVEEEEVCDICGTPMKEEMERCPVCMSTKSPSESKGDVGPEVIGEAIEIGETKEDRDDRSIEDHFDPSDIEDVEESEEETKEIGGTKEDRDDRSTEDPFEPLDIEDVEESEEEVKEFEHTTEPERSEEWRRPEGYPGELDEDKEYIKSVLNSIENDVIDTENVQRELDKLSSYEKQGEYAKASDLSLEILLDIEDLKKLHDLLSGLDETRRRISTDKGSLELSKRVEEIKRKCREGEYSTAVKMAENLSEIPEKHDEKKLEQEFKKKLMKVRGNLRIARETGLSMKGVKENLKSALEAGKSGDMEEGLEILNQGLAKLQKVLVFSSLLEGSKDELRKIRKMGGETTEVSRRLKKIKIKADRGDLIKAIKEINNLFRELEEKKKELEERAD